MPWLFFYLWNVCSFCGAFSVSPFFNLWALYIVSSSICGLYICPPYLWSSYMDIILWSLYAVFLFVVFICRPCCLEYSTISVTIFPAKYPYKTYNINVNIKTDQPLLIFFRGVLLSFFYPSFFLIFLIKKLAISMVVWYNYIRNKER